MIDWFEEMEQAEQENLEYEKSLAYKQGRADAIGELKKYVAEKLDLRFALDVLCKQVIDEYVDEQLKENKNE